MAFAESSDSSSEWPMFGQNDQNTARNDAERKISTSNVATLAPKWVATTGGDVSARAAVVDRVVYFPDWGGNLWALGAATGGVIWQHQLIALRRFPAAAPSPSCYILSFLNCSVSSRTRARVTAIVASERVI